jgi:RNA polymerase-binding transcription factor DksA
MKALKGIPADLNERVGFEGETFGGRIRPKWVWHYRVLLKLRERLLKALSERLADAVEPLESASMNMADAATDEFDHGFTASDLSAGQDALCEVDDALRRILDGTYGICEETGRPIPAARLKAVPWARFGLEVKAQLERRGVVSRPHLATLRSVSGAVTGNLR